MNYKKNRKYLSGSDTLHYIGLGLAILGGVLILIGEMFWIFIIPYQYYVALALAAIGGILVLISSAGAANLDEIDAQIKEKTDALIKDTEELIPKNKARQTEAPVLLGNFILEGDDVIVRKSKDGKYRSSLYSAAAVLYKKESICVSQHIFSLISDKSEENSYEIPYENIPKAIVREKNVYLQDKKLTVKTQELHITDKDGTEIIVPVINSVIIDEFCEKLNSEVKKKTAQ